MSLILDGTNGVSDIDGSAATPAIRGTDANTGMFFPAADTIAFSEGGVESMRLNSSGTLVTTNDASISGLTVGKGGGAVATNAAIGSSALSANTTGAYMTAVNQSLRSNTSGNYNVGIGWALNSNTTGSNNVGTGLDCLATNTTGGANTAYGVQALTSNTTASGNTAVGYQAAYANTTGTGLVAVGLFALDSNTTGNNNTAVGSETLNTNTTGASNTAVGNVTMAANTTGSFNTAFGDAALRFNTTANANTAVGYQAGYSNTTGTFNTFIGAYAGDSVTTGNENTFVGTGAGDNITTGVRNTFIGRGSNRASGSSITTGSNNTIIGAYNGFQDGLDIRTASNNIVISDGDGTPQISYTSADNTWKIPQLYNNTSGSGANVVVLSSGTIARSTSSLKYKRDVQNSIHGLAEVLQLRPVTYKSKSEKDGETVYGGLIAEEVHEAGLTEFVQYAEDGSPDALAYGQMVSLCVKAIQELNAKVEAQALEIAQLKGN